MDEIKVTRKHHMSPVTLSAKVFVGVVAALAGSLTGLVMIGIYIGTTSTTLNAHSTALQEQGVELKELKGSTTSSLTVLSNRTSRMEGMFEIAFPAAAKQLPKPPGYPTSSGSP